MKSLFTPSKLLTLRRIFLLAGIVLFVGMGKSWGQIIYGTTGSSGPINCTAILGCAGSGVTLGTNAWTTPITDSAVMYSIKNVGGILGGGNAIISIKYPSSIPANGVSYVKIKDPVVAGLSLGTVTGLLGIVGSNITISSFKSGTTTAITNTVNVVRNGIGEEFFKITPISLYDSLVILVAAPTLAVTSSITMPVFYSKYDTASITCSQQPIYTDLGTTTGVTVNLSTAIANPELAIDASTATASVLTTGAVALGATTSQTIYFNGLSNATDEVRVLLSVPNSILALGLFNNIKVQTFNGATSTSSVQTVSNSLLGLDLLSLFGSDAIIPVYFKTTSAFDRIVISTSNFIALTAATVNVYDVKRVPGPPTFSTLTSDTGYVCSGSSKTITADAASGYTFQWYASSSETGPAAFFTGNPYITSALTSDTVFYVTKKSASCSQESERKKIRIVVDTLPTITFVTPLYVCQDKTTLNLAYSATTGSPTFYHFQWGAAAILQGFSASVTDVSLPTSPIPITIPLGITPATYTGNNLFITRAIHGNSCSKPYPFNLTILQKPSAAVITNYQ